MNIDKEWSNLTDWEKTQGLIAFSESDEEADKDDPYLYKWIIKFHKKKNKEYERERKKRIFKYR